MVIQNMLACSSQQQLYYKSTAIFAKVTTDEFE